MRKHCVVHLLFFILRISGRRVPRILKLVVWCSPWYLGLCLSCPSSRLVLLVSQELPGRVLSIRLW